MEINGEHQTQKWFVKSYWLQEKKLAYIELIGDFDEDGVMRFNKFWAENYLDKGNAPVHTIIDAAGLINYPKNLGMLREGTSLSVKHPNTGWVLLVGFTGNPVLKFLSSAVSQVLGVRFKQVESLEDAKNVLSRVDDSLEVIA